LLLLAPTAYVFGGVQTWLDDVSRGLAAQGWTVRVGLLAGARHDVAAYRAAWPGLPGAFAIGNPTGSREGRVRALMRAIEGSRADLVVSVNAADSFDAVARLRKEGRSVRLAMSLHGIEPDYFRQIGGEAAWLDAVVVTNRLTAERVKDVGMPADRVLYAPYGVPIDDLAPSAERCDASAAAPFTIGFCGRIEEPQKRVSDLVAIAGRLVAEGVDFRLRVVGDGPEAAGVRERLEALLGDRLAWLGRQPAHVLGDCFYRQIDALLITSQWETGPIVAWEAMAAGVTVVSSRYEGLAEEGALVDGENCLLFPIGDVGGAASELRRLATDRAIGARLAAAARRLVAERYSRDASITAWAEALTRVAAMPLRPVGDRRDGALTAAPAGRLDRWFGVTHAETLRRRLGIAFAHGDAGGEWPHAYPSVVAARHATSLEAAQTRESIQP
jgi:glycosyltransferase involved in cell wall biosynthesis